MISSNTEEILCSEHIETQEAKSPISESSEEKEDEDIIEDDDDSDNNNKDKKRRVPRTNIKPKQREVLMSVFSHTPKPTSQEKPLNIPPRKHKFWQCL